MESRFEATGVHARRCKSAGRFAPYRREFVEPVSALAANSDNSAKSNDFKEHRQELRAMHEKMRAEAKADDAALEKMVAELNKAPESKKVDLEAAILTKLVAQHHQMLGEWESMHAKMQQFRKEHRQMGKAETSTGTINGTGQSTSTAQK